VTSEMKLNCLAAKTILFHFRRGFMSKQNSKTF